MRSLDALPALLLLACCGPGAGKSPPAYAPDDFLGRAARLATVGEQITPDKVEATGFIEDGYFGAEDEPAPTRLIWGSHGPGGDANKGSVTISFTPATRDKFVVIPVITGPTAARARVAVKSASGEVLAALDPATGATQWTWWKVPLKACRPDCSGLILEVQDDGDEWGEWIAVGAPHALKHD